MQSSKCRARFAAGLFFGEITATSPKRRLASASSPWFTNLFSLMTPGTFIHPLCFSTLLVVIGLLVCKPKELPATSAAERAAYEEIVSLWKANDLESIREKCERFLELYPNSKGAEHVAIALGESLVKSGNWKEAGTYYCGMEIRFPKSGYLDGFVFFQGMALFMEADFKEATPLLTRFIKNFPNSPLVENASYYVAMSHFLSNSYKETLAACSEYLRKYPDGKFAGDMQYRHSFIDFSDQRKAQGDDKLDKKNRQDLQAEPKLQDTEPYKKAE
jgi:outer membrane protein assembly factor BamD (BamD/ComL family)